MKATHQRSRRLAVGLNFVFLQDLARSFDLTLEISALQSEIRSSHVVSPEMKSHVGMLIIREVPKDIFATSFLVSVQIVLNMEETG